LQATLISADGQASYGAMEVRPMSVVEDAYARAIDAMPPLQKMASLEGFLVWTRNVIARQVRARLGSAVSEDRIRWEVALQMYESDPLLARLIREQIERVSP
jgi:hypothetical protein